MASTTGRQGNVDSVGRKGPQVAHVPDTEPYTEHTEVNNFEDAGMGAATAKAKNMRGLTQINPNNVRGHANYK